MTKLLYTVIFLLVATCGYSQFHPKKTLRLPFINYFSVAKADRIASSNSNSIPTTFTSDQIETSQLRSPYLLASAASNNASDLYWMSSVTTQSYNQGKLGTYYYWDLQGNLRESRFFFDIAGKNKRGLKLVFPHR